jgi:Tfp pilus assembly protein PilO
MNSEHGRRRNCSSLLWAGAILAGSAGFVFFVARPQMARVRTLTGTAQSERAVLASRYLSLETISKAQQETATLTAKVADFEKRIPAESNVGDFLEELARLAQKRGLQPDTVQPGEPIRGDDVVALPIAIKVHGSFSGIHGLLRDIEHMPRLTRFEKFNAVVDTEYSGDVAAELNLKIFFLPPGRGPAAWVAGGSEAGTG